MKKIAPFLLVICFSLVLAACAPAQGFAQGIVELPSPIQLAILSLVTLVVGFIFTRIAQALPWLGEFLGSYVDEVSVAVAGAVVMAIQNFLNAIPPEWEGVANSALALVVAILAAYGFLKAGRKVYFQMAFRKALE